MTYDFNRKISSNLNDSNYPPLSTNQYLIWSDIGPYKIRRFMKFDRDRRSLAESSNPLDYYDWIKQANILQELENKLKSLGK